MRLDFANASCEDFRLSGIGEMDLFYLKNISREKCIDFIKERIDQDNYLLLFNIDEYEIKYSEYYQVKHYEHDTYIFGYEDEMFHVMAYTDGHLRMLRVAQEEIIASMYSHQEFFGNTHFCSFRIYHCAQENINLEKVVSEITEYLKGGENENGDVFGITTYEMVQALLRYTKEFDGDETLSPKVFRAIWEHKKVMLMRNQHVGTFVEGLDKLEEVIKGLANTGSLLLMLTIKYNMQRDPSILDKMMQYLQEMRSIEKEYLIQFRTIAENYLGKEVVVLLQKTGETTYIIEKSMILKEDLVIEEGEKLIIRGNKAKVTAGDKSKVTIINKGCIENQGELRLMNCSLINQSDEFYNQGMLLISGGSEVLQGTSKNGTIKNLGVIDILDQGQFINGAGCSGTCINMGTVSVSAKGIFQNGGEGAGVVLNHGSFVLGDTVSLVRDGNGQFHNYGTISGRIEL